MCRHLAYLGPPAPLSRWLYDAPHALVHQSYAPRDMRGGGTLNADGFGVGWFADSAPSPLQYRRDRPMWADVDLPALAAATAAPAMMAAVRSATPGMPLGEAACAPFAADGALFSLNGRIAGWPDSVAALAATLPAVELLALPPVDSLLVWLLLRRRLAAGQAPGSAVAAITGEVAAAAPDSRLNLLYTDAHTVVATTLTHSLWVWQGAAAVLVSSEPLDDDPNWTEVADGQLVVASRDRLTVTPLPVPAEPEPLPVAHRAPAPRPEEAIS